MTLQFHPVYVCVCVCVCVCVDCCHVLCLSNLPTYTYNSHMRLDQTNEQITELSPFTGLDRPLGL